MFYVNNIIIWFQIFKNEIFNCLNIFMSFQLYSNIMANLLTNTLYAKTILSVIPFLDSTDAYNLFDTTQCTIMNAIARASIPLYIMIVNIILAFGIDIDHEGIADKAFRHLQNYGGFCSVYFGINTNFQSVYKFDYIRIGLKDCRTVTINETHINNRHLVCFMNGTLKIDDRFLDYNKYNRSWEELNSFVELVTYTLSCSSVLHKHDLVNIICVHACIDNDIEFIENMLPYITSIDLSEGFVLAHIMKYFVTNPMRFRNVLIKYKNCVVNRSIFDTETCVYYCVKNGFIETAKLLIDNGCDVYDRKHLIFTCVKLGNYDMVGYLIDHGIDQKVYDKLATHIVSVDIKNNTTQGLEFLLNRNFDVNKCDDYDVYPITRACDMNSTMHVYMLLRAGANPNPYPCNRLPIFNAIMNNKLGMVKTLVKGGARLDITECGYTPLEYSIMYGYSHERVTNYLTKKSYR